MLPQYEVLLIHSRVAGQRRKFEYSEDLLNFRIALVVSGDLHSYSHKWTHKIHLFVHDKIEPTTDFVLKPTFS